MVRLTWQLGVAFALALSISLPVWAQSESLQADETAQRRSEAETLANTAYDLMQKGLHAEALELFQRADGRFHSPMFTVFIARCQDALGRPADALVNMEKAAQEQPADAPKSFKKARDDARAAIPALARRVPTVTVEVVDGEGASVRVNGAHVDVGRALRLNPGRHEVVVRLSGEVRRRQVTLQEGSAERVRFNFEPLSPPPEPGNSYVAPVVAFGIGGAGLLAGAIVGGVFVGQADEHKEACGADGICPAELEAEGDEIRVLGNLATAALVVGGIGVVTGVVLLVVVSGDDDDAMDAQLRVAPTGAALSIAF